MEHLRRSSRVATVCALLLFALAADAAGQSLGWAKRAGSGAYDFGTGIAVDGAGDIYVTGTFNKCPGCFSFAPTLFDPGGPNETALTGIDGSQDMFVAKYTSSGALVWVKGVGGSGSEDAYGIAVDAAGNSYAVGSTFLAGNFVVKHTSSGNAVWTRYLTPAGYGFAIAADAAGNSYVTGYAGDPIAGGEVVTFWKIDAGGSVDWVRQATGPHSGGGVGIAVDGGGSIYVTGHLTGTAIFGPGEPNETPISGGQAMFVAKYDGSGALTWVRHADGALMSGIAIDPAGNPHVVGGGNTVLGAGEPEATTVSGIFAAAYGATGDLIWARTISGVTVAEGKGIAVDSTGNTFVTGYIAASVFITKHDVDGNLLWTRLTIPGDSSGAGGASVATDALGNAYVTGLLVGDNVFGAGEPSETTLSSSNILDRDIFIAKYLPLDPPNIAATKVDQLLVDANGNGLVNPGDRIRYRIDMSNSGGDAAHVVFSDSPDVNTTLVAGSVTTQGTVMSGNTAGDTIVRVDLGAVPSGGEATIVFDVDVNMPFPQGVTHVANRGSFAALFSGVMEVATDDPDNPTSDSDYTVTLVEPSDNDEPLAANQSVTTPEDTPIAIVLSATDPDNDPLSYFVVSPPQHGTLNGTGAALTYTPAPNYFGDDFFTFWAFDGTAYSNVATVAITVTPVNDIPLAHNQVLVTAEDTPLQVTLTGQDVDGDPLQFIIVSGPAHGTLTPTSPTTLTYTPALDYVGPDSFTFVAFDGTANSAPATVSITVGVPPLSCGSLQSGTIIVAGEVDRFSIAGSAGDIISLALASTGGFTTNASSRSAELTLFAPSGAAVGVLRSNRQGNLTLPATGAYEIRVRAANRSTTGSYNFNVECLFPVPSPDAVPVGYGTLSSGRIDAAAEVDLLVFSGQANEIVSLALASTGGFTTNASSTSVELTLFAPLGAAVGVLRSNRQNNLTLPVTGAYVIRVSAANLATLGGYNVNLERLAPTASPDAVPVGYGTLSSGRIAAAAEVDLFVFSGQANEIVSLALASTDVFTTNASSSSAELTLFAPSGAAVGVLRSNRQGNLTLPETGAYVIRVSAANLATVGGYNVNLERIAPPSPDAVSVGYGTLSSGRIDAAAEVDLFVFSGQANEIVSLALANTGGFTTNASSSSVELTLFAPSGAAVGGLRSNRQGNLTLPETGSYVIRVSAANLATVGGYNVNLERLAPTASPDTLGLSCGTPAAGRVEAAAEADLFGFSGLSGASISLTLTSTGGFTTNAGNSSAELMLFTPSGAVVGTIRSNRQGTFVLPVAGAYVIRVNAANLATLGTYEVRLGCSS